MLHLSAAHRTAAAAAAAADPSADEGAEETGGWPVVIDSVRWDQPSIVHGLTADAALRWRDG